MQNLSRQRKLILRTPQNIYGDASKPLRINAKNQARRKQNLREIYRIHIDVKAVRSADASGLYERSVEDATQQNLKTKFAAQYLYRAFAVSDDLQIGQSKIYEKFIGSISTSKPCVAQMRAAFMSEA